MDIELKINLKDYIKVRDCLKWLVDEGSSGEIKEAFEIIDNLIPVAKRWDYLLAEKERLDSEIHIYVEPPDNDFTFPLGPRYLVAYNKQEKSNWIKFVSVNKQMNRR